MFLIGGGALMGLATSVGFSTFLSFAPALLKAMKKQSSLL